MIDSDAVDARRCSWCAGHLPLPIEALAVVHGPEGTILLACGVPCLAELVAALAGRPEQTRQPVMGRLS